MSKHIRKVLGLLQHRKQIPPAHQQPTSRTPEEWSAYWKVQGQPWRTEPEIDKRRQEYLAERRLITPNIAQGIYPFKDIESKLTRADIEWLLATHESRGMFGPVDWSDESQREREGLDLRGADLRHASLHDLPLTGLRGGLTVDEWESATEEQRTMATTLLEGADFRGTRLQGANLWGARLQGATLARAQLRKAYLREAQLQKARLGRAQLQGANLLEARLQGADLEGAELQEAFLRKAQFQGANLTHAQLQKATLSDAQLQEAIFFQAQLQGASFSEAQLQGAILIQAKLQNAYLGKAQLQRASLREAQLQGATLDGAQLQGASLRGAQLQGASVKNVVLSDKQRIGPRLADVQWGDTNLTVVEWSQVVILGDEWLAQQKREHDGTKKERGKRLAEYRTAARAYRQLATALQTQGLNEDAARFAYRAQMLQRKVFWYQAIDVIVEYDDDNSPLLHQFVSRLQSGIRKFGQYLFSLLLDLLAGYGYKPWRSFLAYLLVITAFATTYFIIGHTVGPSLSAVGSVVLSMTAFHGRGFFPGGIALDDPLTILAALEAFVGLLIEVTFIATLTQRFFGK